MAIKCTECGASITDDSRFCKYCGAKLPEEVKEDKKRREFRFEFNSEGSVRRAEIRKEREAQKQEHEREMMRQQQEELDKRRKAQAEADKSFFKTLAFAIGALVLIYVLTKIF